MHIKTVFFVLLLLVLPPQEQAACQTAEGIDSGKQAALCDSLFAHYMDYYTVPGAVISIVQADSILFEKGYGYADLENKSPVDPESTLFRVASITKLFTAAAVMKLAGSDPNLLEKDLNQYLTELGIEKKWNDPVTLRHLLTHTAGFDNSDIGDAAEFPGNRLEMEEFLKSRMTKQIYRPGRFRRYSNHGYTLVGYLVEKFSGVTYEENVRQNILTPLNMNRSSLVQSSDPLPGLLVAKSYDNLDSVSTPLDATYSNVVPADGLVSTARDMSRFMQMFLNKGTLDGNDILDESVVNMMLSNQFSNHNSLPGYGIGFIRETFGTDRSSYGEMEAFSHTGGILGFSSELILIPKMNAGIFISVTRRSAAMRYRILNELIMNWFAGQNTVPPATYDDKELLPGKYPGTYMTVDHNRSTLEKFESFLSGSSYFEVFTGESGNLRTEDDSLLTMLTPHLFKRSSGNRFIGFSRDADGQYLHVFNRTFKKLEYYQVRSFQLKIVLSCILTFLIYVTARMVLWIIRAVSRPKKNVPGPDKNYHRAAITVSVTGALFPLLIEIIETPQFDFGMPLSVKLILLLPVMFVLQLPVLCYLSFRSLRENITFFRVSGHLFFAAVCLVYVVWLNYWNLLGFRF